MKLTMLDEEAVLEEFCRAHAAAELRPQSLRHVRPMLVLQVRQQERVLREGVLAQVAFVKMVIL